jgi:hypothetical protein
MFTEIHLLAHLERHKDLLREAKQERLARLAALPRAARKAEKKPESRREIRCECLETVCCMAAA